MAHDVGVGDPGWFIVVNPASGGGRTRRTWPLLARELERCGLRFRAAITAAPGDAASLARDAVDGGVRRLLAIGGDGTLHEMLNGLFAQGRLPPEEVAIAVAPSGSGNDWARTMHMPHDPARLADAMATFATRRVDLGFARCHTPASGADRSVVFHNAAGAGLDAEVVKRTPRLGPRAPAYLVGMLRALWRFRAPDFEIRAGVAAHSGRYLTAIAAIGPDCGGGMRVAPKASVDDGEFDLVLVDDLPLIRAIALARGLWNGSAALDPAFRSIRCRQATVAASPACDVEADGQLIGRTPLAVEILPSGLLALDCRPGAGAS